MTAALFAATLFACDRAAPDDGVPSDGYGGAGGAGGSGGTAGAGGGGTGGAGGTSGAADGDLVLSEIVDHASSAQVKFVEVYNPGSTAVNLTGWSIVRYSNGGTEGVDVPLGGTDLAAGDAFVVVNLDGDADFQALFGVTADLTSDEVNGNGNDAWALAFQGTTVDVYGEIGVDGVGTAWEYTDSVATRALGASSPTTTWSAADWSISSGAGSASPGVHDGGGGGTGGTGGAGGAGGSGGTGGPPTGLRVTIYDVQSGDVAADTDVTVAGVVTGVGGFGIFVQDEAGGPYSGAWAYLGGDWEDDWGTLVVGDRVTLTALYNEYNDLTELNVTDAATPSVVRTGGGAGLVPSVVDLGDLVADPEPWEGVLIEVGPVEVGSLPSDDTFGEWEIVDASDDDVVLLVNDSLYAWPDPLVIGQAFDAVAGPLNYTFDAFKIEPRDAADFAVP